jgi:wyosine [tRNA(Phe)-imidazoG37] synthetase (radical SAM superfamily)
MPQPEHHIAFGPIPSRRLGWSLGINNIPAKACSYTCLYCQVGPTTEKIIEPREFFTPGQIVDAVGTHLARARQQGTPVDYLTFVPDGEPTLDIHLGETIAKLKPLGVPVAVLTNASLLWREDVRAGLAQADLVSVKVDAVTEATWRRIDLPHHGLQLERVLAGMRAFAAGYAGKLISETMLLAGLNDDEATLTATAEFLASIGPHTAYIAIPTRPPTVASVHGSDALALTRAHEIFAARLPRVELLTGHETEAFAHTGDARIDLLGITAVHPMRESAVRQLLRDDGADWGLVESLLASGELKHVDYEGQRFYLRPVKVRHGG